MEKLFLINEVDIVSAADEDAAIATYHKRKPHSRVLEIREVKRI